MPKDRFQNGIVVHVHPKAWMDEAGMKIWLNKVWKNHPGGLSKKKSILVLDSFSAHLTDAIKVQLKQENTDMAVIPGGLTSMVQPLDVCLNKPFKDRLREKWNNWMNNETKSYTAGGHMMWKMQLKTRKTFMTTD